jgi:dTDP-4-dehydrorhamnose reductase
MSRLLVTGAGGQLGSTLADRFRSTAEVLALTRAALDISDEAAVARAVRDFRPDAIVNCAAYNNVDGAEQDAAAALHGNALGVLALARSARAVGAIFVHYSTDFVFDGTGNRPYEETDPPRPLSVYGSSKLLGEWFAADAPVAYVLRVESLFGGLRARSSTDRILDAIRAGQPARVFVDRTVTPSYVDDVIEATARILERRPDPGLYHCVNSGTCTWYDIAREAARLLGVDAELVPVKVAEVTLVARRPQYCALSNAKLAAAGIAMPSWQDALARYLQKIGAVSAAS